MKKRAKIILVLIIIFSCLILLKVVIRKPVEGKRFAGKRTIEKVAVKVMPVKKGNVDFVLSYVGSIKARDEVNVFSKVPGKLTEYAVNEGDKVEKGQIIALVDRDETGLKYELAKVDTPLAGIVGRVLLDKGDSVLPGASGTAVAIVVNMEEMTVRLNISEQDIPYIKKGLAAIIKVDAYPQENFEGEVYRVSEVVDPETRTLPIEIIIPNQDHKLKSGMFARIKIVASQRKDVLVLSQDAVIQELGASYVFVVENDTAIKKGIKIGIRENSRVEILEGVSENEQAIVFGQQGLKDGTPVAIANE